MNDKSKRRFWQIHLSTAIVLMFIAAVLLGVLVWLTHVDLREQDTSDAALVICLTLLNELSKHGSLSVGEINTAVKGLRDASVTNVNIRQDGTAVDSFGTPFQITLNVKSDNEFGVRVISAGKDGQFGSDDDIVQAHGLLRE